MSNRMPFFRRRFHLQNLTFALCSPNGNSPADIFDASFWCSVIVLSVRVAGHCILLWDSIRSPYSAAASSHGQRYQYRWQRHSPENWQWKGRKSMGLSRSHLSQERVTKGHSHLQSYSEYSFWCLAFEPTCMRTLIDVVT